MLFNQTGSCQTSVDPCSFQFIRDPAEVLDNKNPDFCLPFTLALNVFLKPSRVGTKAEAEVIRLFLLAPCSETLTL